MTTSLEKECQQWCVRVCVDDDNCNMEYITGSGKQKELTVYVTICLNNRKYFSFITILTW